MDGTSVDGADRLFEAVSAVDLLSAGAPRFRTVAKQLAREWPRARERGAPIKVALLSGFTTDYLEDALRLTLYRRGFAADIVAAGYGQLVNEVLTGGPALRSAPDVVLVLPTHRDLRHAPGLGASRAEAEEAADREARFWSDLVKRIERPVVMLSFDQPPYRALGELDGFSPSGLGGHARRTNARLYDSLPGSATLVDAESLQARIGSGWHDAHVYTLCKQPFAMSAIPEVCDTLAAAVTALRGCARKVLVLDLDNTVWGGVVGDVGMENLEIGSETPEGEAFSSFQQYVKTLANRGVILALCSKNNEEIAWSAFRNHPAMVLKEADIAAFVVNFEEKATNIRRIAEVLNVGVDSLVFADDNPIERAWVHQQNPEVLVIDMPEDPSGYAGAIEAAKAFPMAALTKEDLGRNESYRAIAVARSESEQALDIDSFLRDLKPVLTVEAVADGSIDRISQLIGKTNQFKMNPTTFDVEAVRRKAQDVVALRLADRLQDYGIVAVAVTTPEDGLLRVDNWVMSCRVFGRRLENAMVEVLADLARSRGLQSLALRFVPSAKNGLVPDLLRAVGFVEAAEGEWYRAAGDVETAPHFMTVHDQREKRDGLN